MFLLLGLTGLLLLSWLLLLLLLQLLLMVDTVEALHNILNYGCGTGGNLCTICFGGYTATANGV